MTVRTSLYLCTYTQEALIACVFDKTLQHFLLQFTQCNSGEPIVIDYLMSYYITSCSFTCHSARVGKAYKFESHPLIAMCIGTCKLIAAVGRLPWPHFMGSSVSRPCVLASFPDPRGYMYSCIALVSFPCFHDLIPRYSFCILLNSFPCFSQPHSQILPPWYSSLRILVLHTSWLFGGWCLHPTLH